MSSFYNTNKQTLQKSICDYFGNAIMTKVRDFQDKYSLYYAKMNSLCYSEDKYIIAIVQQNTLPVGSKQFLINLDWVSFQTRIIDTVSVPIKSQTVKSKISQSITDKISVVRKKEDRYVYSSTKYPIEIELMFNEKDDSYASEGTIQSALDTYSCVITFIF